MKKNGAKVIHFATGMVVGYSPCPRIDYFRRYIKEAFDLPVIVGTHPVPEKYITIHTALGTWNSPLWQELIQPTLATPEILLDYNQEEQGFMRRPRNGIKKIKEDLEK